MKSDKPPMTPSRKSSFSSQAGGQGSKRKNNTRELLSLDRTRKLYSFAHLGILFGLLTHFIGPRRPTHRLEPLLTLSLIAHRC